MSKKKIHNIFNLEARCHSDQLLELILRVQEVLEKHAIKNKLPLDIGMPMIIAAFCEILAAFGKFNKFEKKSYNETILEVLNVAFEDYEE